ncbi:MAG: chemotaxis protein CheW [Pseudomonadota bacterium]
MNEQSALSSLNPSIPQSLVDGGKRDGSLRFVVFRLGKQGYALPLEQVELALRMVSVAQVPDAPPGVIGVIDLHGQVISVMDLRQRFNQPDRKPHPDDRLLVVTIQEQTLALLVDKVSQVLEVTKEQIEFPPEPLPQGGKIMGMIRQEEGLIMILDTNRLLEKNTDEKQSG